MEEKNIWPILTHELCDVCNILFTLFRLADRKLSNVTLIIKHTIWRRIVNKYFPVLIQLRQNGEREIICVAISKELHDIPCINF